MSADYEEAIHLAELHDLACTGSTPEEGCVCAPKPLHRLSATDRFLDAADAHRTRSEELIRAVEVLMGKLQALPAIPLDLLDRYERAITRAHTANLLRLPSYSDLGEDEA